MKGVVSLTNLPGRRCQINLMGMPGGRHTAPAPVPPPWGAVPVLYGEARSGIADKAASRTRRKQGVREFLLYADINAQRLYATVLTKSAVDGVAVYEVQGAHGEPVGAIIREKAWRGTGLRTRWAVQPAYGGAPEIVGHKGGIFWWCVWWLLSPVWAILIPLSIAGGDVPRPPRRIIWRTPAGEDVMATGTVSENYAVFAEWLDPRLVCALVALHRSHLGWATVPGNWDD